MVLAPPASHGDFIPAPQYCNILPITTKVPRNYAFDSHDDSNLNKAQMMRFNNKKLTKVIRLVVKNTIEHETHLRNSKLRNDKNNESQKLVKENENDLDLNVITVNNHKSASINHGDNCNCNSCNC